jgi:hypothetical protein
MIFQIGIKNLRNFIFIIFGEGELLNFLLELKRTNEADVIMP